MAYENKCKVNNSDRTPVILCEMFASDCKEHLFTCWSKKTITAFKVKFDNEIWETLWTELNLLYGVETLKKPIQFLETRNKLEMMVQ